MCVSQVSVGQLKQVVNLLEDIKDPRYIDFLLSICTCGDEPMPSNQVTNTLRRQTNKDETKQYQQPGDEYPTN